MIGPLANTIEASRRRAGLTLAEVLIAVFVMAIGVASLAALFPLAVLRSVKASQLTNATILRYNAEELQDVMPRGYAYSQIDTSMPPDGIGDTAGLPAAPTSGNLVGVIDPIGFAAVGGGSEAFGNTGGAAVTGLSVWRAPGYNSDAVPLAAQPAVARALGSLGDSFNDVYSGLIDSIVYDTGNGEYLVTLEPGEVDLSDFIDPAATPAGTPYANSRLRVVLVGDGGRANVVGNVRLIQNGGAGTANQFAVVAAEPAGVPAAAFTEARVEVAETRYSYLISVRKRQLIGSMGEINYTAVPTVVTFFRRVASIEDEGFFYHPSGTATNVFNFGNEIATIDLDRDDDGTADRELGKGDWVFDPVAGIWYQILSTWRESILDPTIINVELDRPAIADSTGAVIMRGVIDVYNIQPVEGTGP